MSENAKTEQEMMDCAEDQCSKEVPNSPVDGEDSDDNDDELRSMIFEEVAESKKNKKEKDVLEGKSNGQDGVTDTETDTVTDTVTDRGIAESGHEKTADVQCSWMNQAEDFTSDDIVCNIQMIIHQMQR